ncbi:hypothetical protein SFR_6966 (plasmid) [Streptomyces sp. FR-008]|nr:hypothetical protein SFR_6966 [Streptomyces sp. FR-008]
MLGAVPASAPVSGLGGPGRGCASVRARVASLAGEDQFVRVSDPAGRVVVEVASHGVSGRTLRSG